MPSSSVSQPPIFPAATRPLGWAGLLFQAPASFRLTHVTGTHDKGSLRLGDAAVVRMEIVWGKAGGRRFNPELLLKRRLERDAKGAALREIMERARLQTHATFAPFWHIPPPADAGTDATERWLGYCARTSRVIEVTYHRGTGHENRLIHDELVPGLVDQPPEQPARWAFFDVSFAAPAGFKLHAATLNLGDMMVELAQGTRPETGPWLTIRQIYPAALALARQPLANWLAPLIEEVESLYYFPRIKLWRRTRRSEPVTCAGGDGLTATARRRFPLGLFFWKCPRYCRVWLWHDTAANRLIFVASGQKARTDAQSLQEVISSLHWARQAEIQP